MTGSPNHPTGSGRATPRTTGPTNTYYPHNNGYATPPPSRQPSSSLYSVITNDRSSSNGASGNGVYNPADDMNHSMPNGYSQPPVHNGMKRGRDDDGDHSRAGVPGDMGPLDLKRRKTLESSVPAPAYDAMNRPASAISGGPQQR
jgi:protein SOK2